MPSEGHGRWLGALPSSSLRGIGKGGMAAKNSWTLPALGHVPL